MQNCWRAVLCLLCRRSTAQQHPPDHSSCRVQLGACGKVPLGCRQGGKLLPAALAACVCPHLSRGMQLARRSLQGRQAGGEGRVGQVGKQVGLRLRHDEGFSYMRGLIQLIWAGMGISDSVQLHVELGAASTHTHTSHTPATHAIQHTPQSSALLCSAQPSPAQPNLTHLEQAGPCNRILCHDLSTHSGRGCGGAPRQRKTRRCCLPSLLMR